MTVSEVRERIRFDSVSKKGDVFTVRKGFFYTNGRTTADLVELVKAAFPTAIIHDSGEVWEAFRGGAPVAKQSHWFVKFSVQ